MALDKQYQYQVPFKIISYGELININNLESLSVSNEFMLNLEMREKIQESNVDPFVINMVSKRLMLHR